MNYQVSPLLQAAQQAAQQSAQQVPDREAHQIADDLRSREGVVLAFYQDDCDYFFTYPLSQTLAMIESYQEEYLSPDLSQSRSLTDAEIREAETLMASCLNALHASGSRFAFMLYVAGWDFPKFFHTTDHEYCGLDAILDLLTSEMQM